MLLSTARSINKPRLLFGMNTQVLGAVIGLAALAVIMSDGLLERGLLMALLCGVLWFSKVRQRRDSRWPQVLKLRFYQRSLYDPFKRAPFRAQIQRRR